MAKNVLYVQLKKTPASECAIGIPTLTMALANDVQFSVVKDVGLEEHAKGITKFSQKVV